MSAVNDYSLTGFNNELGDIDTFDLGLISGQQYSITITCDDIIFDFNANADGEKMDLTDVTEITDFTDLEDNHMAQVGSDVVITDGANTITLEDVSLNKLDGDDFVF